MSESEWLDLFGDNLRFMLYEANMTQRELADAAGLSESVISDYINKRKMPGIRAVLNIAHALDIDIAELIDYGVRII
jgi:transcriptional regulator with XRE-family HTH domain